MAVLHNHIHVCPLFKIFLPLFILNVLHIDDILQRRSSKIKLLREKTPALISFYLSLKFSTKQELFPRSEMQDLNHA